MKLKLTVGIRSEGAPVVIEGEESGVFLVHGYEIKDEDAAHKEMMACWALREEKDALAAAVEIKWEEL